MEFTHEGHIDLGNGGLILPTAANEMLLRQLRETTPLSQPQLLKLARFFKGFPTQLALGNHMALLALTKLEMQKDVFLEYADGDFLEDIADFWTDEGPQDAAGPSFFSTKPTASFVQLTARWIKVSGIGLCIESVDYTQGDSVKRRDFVVGVSPNPDKLPEA